MVNIRMNWYPDYWTKEERELLFKFWRERYSKTIINMSPTGKPAGGLGFFDAEWQSYKYKTFKPVYIENHVVNESYKKRRASLLKEQKESLPADKYRIELLLEAEKKAWEWWKQTNLFKSKSGDPKYFIELSQDRNLAYEMAYKEAFANLIEYDRHCEFALADPDRDLKKQPLTIMEYRNWLDRHGRGIQKGSEDDLILENIWLGINKTEETPQLKDNLIPELLEEYHRNQERSDKYNNIKRNLSGEIINGKQLKNRQNKVSFDSTGNLTEDIRLFREKFGIAKTYEVAEDAKVVENVDDRKQDFDKDLENHLNDIISHFCEHKEETSGGFPLEGDKKDIIFPPLPKTNPYSQIKDLTLEEEEFKEEDDYLSLDEINKLIENKNESKPEKENVVIDISKNIKDIPIENVEKEDVDTSTDSSGENESVVPDEASWEEEAGQSSKISSKQISTHEKVRRVKRKNRKIFDRNKQLKQMKKSWVSLPVREEKGFWVSTRSKIKDFKSASKNLWENRVKNLLSIDNPEQKSLLKVKSLELASIKNKVLSKRKPENREAFKNVKKVSLHSPKLKRNR